MITEIWQSDVRKDLVQNQQRAQQPCKLVCIHHPSIHPFINIIYQISHTKLIVAFFSEEEANSNGGHYFFPPHLEENSRENEEHSWRNEDRSAKNILSNSYKFMLEPPIFQIIIYPTQILKMPLCHHGNQRYCLSAFWKKEKIIFYSLRKRSLVHKWY